MVSTLDDEARSAIERAALINATKHEGKAEVGAVIGRVLAEIPELRSNSGKVSKEAAAVVKRINSRVVFAVHINVDDYVVFSGCELTPHWCRGNNA
jgi:hypothetical protein